MFVHWPNTSWAYGVNTYVPFSTGFGIVHTFSHVPLNASPDTRDVDVSQMLFDVPPTCM